ncbi:MAG: cell division protein FtsQ [Prevotella sp.]|nr:cell division protein FtsQ [Candidatus Prevotella equi]
MKLNINWKKTLLVTLDLCIAAYLFMAFTSWNKPTETVPVCTKVVINIADENENGFLNSSEIKALLEKHHIYPLSKRIDEINPRNIEDQLTHMPFVNTAQCYTTQEGHVCVTITQRTPIVRVKSFTGEDYYIDDNGGVMPNSQYTSDMIIVTGSVTRYYACNYIYILAKIFMSDNLWRNQIEQINVTPDKTIELVPRVGDHIINIGQLPSAADKKQREELITEYVDNQMKRLHMFYKHGLSNAGWNKYDYISLEFTNQIVCRKNETSKTHHQPTPVSNQSNNNAQ